MKLAFFCDIIVFLRSLKSLYPKTAAELFHILQFIRFYVTDFFQFPDILRSSEQHVRPSHEIENRQQPNMFLQYGIAELHILFRGE